MSRLSPSSSVISNVVSPVISQTTRNMSGFFRHGEGDILWKTMAGVSAQGKKRGRARNTMKKKNLNTGKRIGFGAAKISWPGLTDSIIHGAGKQTRVKQIRCVHQTSIVVNYGALLFGPTVYFSVIFLYWRTDGRTDRPSYKNARTHLEIRMG